MDPQYDPCGQIRAFTAMGRCIILTFLNTVDTCTFSYGTIRTDRPSRPISRWANRAAQLWIAWGFPDVSYLASLEMLVHLPIAVKVTVRPQVSFRGCTVIHGVVDEKFPALLTF